MTKLEKSIMVGIILLTLVAMCGGCRENPDKSIIRDTQRNPAFYVVDIKPTPPEIASPGHRLPETAISGKAVFDPPASGSRKGAAIDRNAGKQAGINAGKVVPVPPPQFQPPHDENKASAGLLLPNELTIWSHPTCEPCKRAKRAIESRYGVDCNLRTKLPQRIAALETVPVFEWTCRNGTKLFIADWNVSPDFDVCVTKLMQRIDRNMRANVAPVVTRIAGHRHHRDRDSIEVEPAVAAAGFGGAIKARAEVVRAFAFLRERVGENVPMTFRWARTGLQTFPVYGAPQNWSIEAICGKYGSVELSAPGCKLPVDRASVKYDVSGDKIGIETRVEFDLPNGAPKAGAKPVGFVDPASLMTIFSVIRGVWAIFKTRVSVDIGGNVEAKAVLSGDVLAVDFSRGPSVRIESLFSFYVAVKRVEITPDSAMVYFSGSRWIKSRRFSLN